MSDEGPPRPSQPPVLVTIGGRWRSPRRPPLNRVLERRHLLQPEGSTNGHRELARPLQHPTTTALILNEVCPDGKHSTPHRGPHATGGENENGRFVGISTGRRVGMTPSRGR